MLEALKVIKSESGNLMTIPILLEGDIILC